MPKKNSKVEKVEYVATALESHKNCYGEVAIRKGQKCTFKKIDLEKYKKTGRVNFVIKPDYYYYYGYAVYKDILVSVKKVTTIITTEIIEEEI